MSYLANKQQKNKLGIQKVGWNKIRKRNKCQNCGWEGICDRSHIIPRHLGGTFEKNNILILCPNCHRMFDRGLLDLSGLILSLKLSRTGAE